MIGQRIYVAGPLAVGRPGLEDRISAACAAGAELMARGAVPYVPHLCALWADRWPAGLRMPAEAEWLRLVTGWLVRADAVVRLPGDSPGADVEVSLARQWGLPVYQGLEACLAGQAEAVSSSVACPCGGTEEGCRRCGGEGEIDRGELVHEILDLAAAAGLAWAAVETIAAMLRDCGPRGPTDDRISAEAACAGYEVRRAPSGALHGWPPTGGGSSACGRVEYGDSEPAHVRQLTCLSCVAVLRSRGLLARRGS